MPVPSPALLLAAVCSFVATTASAAPSCPATADISQKHLLGTWQAQVEGLAAPATLKLVKHPQYAETVRGVVERAGQRLQVSGDVDNGEFTLEESANGTNISATWLGDVVDGSCGREIRGTWKAEGEAAPRGFVLKKLR